MKMLLNKFYIHPLTYIILFILLHEGLIRYTLVISLVLLIHEMGHLFFIKLFKRKISLIKILPFGSLIKLDSNLSNYIYEDILISIGGIFFQVISLFIIKDSMFSFYNKLIIIFNMLPICPLDGYRIVKLLLELFIPYKKTFKISFIISIISIIILLVIKSEVIFFNLLIIIFLIYSSFKEYSLCNYYMYRFYYERKKCKTIFKKVVYITKREDMYKNRFNMINNMREDIYLQEGSVKYLFNSLK